MTALPNISPDLIKKYQEQIASSSSEATAKRKAMSLNKFFDWAEGQGHIEQNPIIKNEVPGSLQVISKPKKKTGVKTWATITLTAALVILIFLLLRKLQFPIPFIWTPAQETNVQIVNNNQPGASPSGIPAQGAVIGAWNLYAKLKLSSVSGTPQVGTQTLSFKLYNQQTGGTALYTSDPISITTDSNGSALISLDKVPTDLFFQNNQLFLEPTIGSTVMGTRIPIETANVAANLGGYFPANPETGAGPLTVPVIDSTGALKLAGQSPAVKAESGNLLIEGQTVTVKAADGSGGNIVINPDGNGIAQFLFEGNGQNFLNAQAPNLTNGSLLYGVVQNNALGTAYNLINLQSGIAPTTKFSVDGSGNTYIAGNTNVTGNINTQSSIQTGGITRLNNLGRLGSITGYYQDSGAFQAVQGAPDYAKITKTATSGTGSALADVLTLTLDESALTTGSNYSTLVLNRLGGSGSNLALKVASGNAKFAGQLQLGNFSSNPGSIGTGSMVYNTSDNQVYVWTGSAWTAVGAGSNPPFSAITSGTNIAAAMVVGSGASLTYSGTGTINASSFGGLSAISGSSGQLLTSGGSGTPTWTNIASSLTAGTDISITGTTNATIADTSTLNSVTGRGATTSNGISVGNLTSTGTTTFGGLTYTWPGSQTNNFVLSTNGTGTLSWADPSSLVSANIYWTQAQGALFPKNNSVDVLIGSNATTSAKFAFMNVNSANAAVASISGSTNNANDSLILDGAGNISTTNKQNLTLGNSATYNSTGNILLNPNGTGKVGIGTTNPLYPLQVQGNVVLSDSAGTARLTLANDGSSIISANGTAFTINVNHSATPPIVFQILGVEKARITNNGVGIGTSSPTALLDVNGNASVSGTLAFHAGTGIIQTTTFSNLALGGSTTGNIILSPSNDIAGGFMGPNTAGNTDLGTSTNYFRNIFGGVVNAVTSVNTGAGAGTARIDASGNLTNIGTTQFNTQTYTWPSGGQSSNFVLSTNGTGALSWSDPNALVAATQYWNQASGALFPKNNSVDVLIGSSATTSAKFAFKNVLTGIPTASVAGNIANVATYLTGNGNLATTNFQNLTVGGSTTGNIILSPSNDAAGGFIGPNTNANTDLGTSTNAFRNIYGTTLLTGGTQRIDSSGNLTSIGTTQLNGVTYTWPGASTANFVLQANSSGASSTLSWVDPNVAVASTIFWTQANGALFPKNNSVDVLIGSNATTSAKFAFKNVNSGLPTASIAGDITNVAAYLTGDGNLATTNMRDLTLGGSTTGQVILNSRNNNTLIANGTLTTVIGDLQSSAATANLFTTGTTNLTIGAAATTLNLQGASGLTLNLGNANGATAINYTSGTGSQTFTSSNATGTKTAGSFVFNDAALSSGDLIYATSGGALTSGNLIKLGTGGNTTFSGNAIYGDLDNTGQGGLGFTGNFLRFDNATVTKFTLSSAGTITMAGNILPSVNNGSNIGSSSSLQFGTIWANLFVQNGNNVCDSSGANCPGNSLLWAQTQGAIYPVNNTVDLLIGANSTASAKFAFKNVNSGLPTATIAGDITNVATYLTGDGNLATTNMRDLTLGGSTTGQVILNSRNNNTLIANGTLTTVIGDLQSSAATANLFTTGTTNLTIGAVATTLNLQGASGLTANIGNANGATAINYTSGTGSQTFTSSNATGTKTAGAFVFNDTALTTGDMIYATASAITGGNIIKIGQGGNTNFTGNVIYGDIDNTGQGGIGFTGNFLRFDNALVNKYLLDSGGNASQAGTLTFGGTAVVQSTATNPLTIGGSTTGNITLNPLNAVAGGFVAPAVTNVSDLGQSGLRWRNIYGQALFQNGNAVCDSTGANCPAGATQFWAQTSGALYPINNSVDLLVGSNATTSAKFAFKNVLTGTPTASISGSTNIATFIDGNGNIATTNTQNLVLGNSATYPTGTGNVLLNPNGTGKVGIGTTAPTGRLTIQGASATESLITLKNTDGTAGVEFRSGGSGQRSTFVGLSAGLTSGTQADNAGFGANALQALTTGYSNTAVGSSALTANTSGFQMTAVGNTALSAMQNGSNDVAVGYSALSSNVSGSNNVAVGTFALSSATVDKNTGIGDSAGGNITSGIGNTILGYFSGGGITTGSYNTIIGGNVTGLSAALSNNIIIADGQANQRIRIDSSGNVGIGTPAPAAFLNTVDSITTTGSSVYATASAITSGNILKLGQGGNTPFTGIGLLMDFDNTGGGGGTFTGNFEVFKNNSNVKYQVDASGNVTTAGNIALNGGSLTTTQTTANIFTSTATTINLGINGSGNVNVGGGSGANGCTFNDANGNLSCAGSITGGTTSGTQGWWQLNSGGTTGGVLFPINNTADLLIGGNSTASAKFAFTNVLTGSPTASISGNLSIAVPTGANPATTYNIFNGGTFNLKTSPGGNAGLVPALFIANNTDVVVNSTIDNGFKFDVNGTFRSFGSNFSTYTDTTGNFFSTGQAVIGGTGLADRLRVVDVTAGGRATLTVDNDNSGAGSRSDQVRFRAGGVYKWSIGNDLNVDGTQNLFISDDVASLNRFFINASGNVGVNTTSPLSKLSVVGTSANSIGKAAFLVDQYESQDILTASASGTTKLSLTSTGNLSAAGALQIGAATNSVAYSRLGTTASANGLTTNSDLMISGKEEIGGVLYLDGRTIANSLGTASIILSATPTSASNILTAGSWDVENTSDTLHAALIANQTQGAVYNGDIFTASFSGTPKFTIHNDSSFTMAGLTAAPVNNNTSGTIYYNTTDSSLYYRNGAGWVSLDPTKGGKSAIHAIYRLLASEYQPVGNTNQYAQFESIARGVSFDNFSDTTKTDVANTTVSGPTQVSVNNPTAIPGPSAPFRTGLFGGQTYNTTNTDSAGKTYLGSNVVNKTYFYDRNRDSSPQVQVELGIDPNWFNGVTLAVATTSAQLSQNDTIPRPNPNLSTTYNGSLIKATGNYASNAQTIYITIKSPTTFDWTDYNGNAATNVTITPGTAQALGGTGVSATFTQDSYNVGDIFKIESWFVEPSSATRGAKAQFPERSYLIAESNSVDIIDSDTQKLWMHFNEGASANDLLGNVGAVSVAMLNGILYQGQGAGANGLYRANFISDIGVHNGTGGTNYYGANIAQRNGGKGYVSLSTGGGAPNLVSANVNDVAVAVIPNQPTQTMTVSGWGYIAANATNQVSESVNLPYKFNNVPMVVLQYAGATSSSTNPTSLSNCTVVGAGVDLVGAAVGGVGTNSFTAYLNKNGGTFTGLNYCYSWTATGTVSPKQFVVAAEGTSASGASDVINDTDGTVAHIFSANGVAASQLWQTKVAIAGNAAYFANQNSSSNVTNLKPYYGIHGLTTEATNQAKIRGTYGIQNISSFGGITTGPVILGTVTGTLQINSLAATQGTSTIDGKSNTIYVSTTSGLSVIQEQQGLGNLSEGSEENSGSVKYYTNNYISEEMVSDIRGMWPLSSNGALSMSDVSIKADTLTNNGTATAVSAVRGVGVSLNGTTQYLSCTNASCGGTSKLDVAASTAFSYGAWFKTSTSGANQTIIGKKSSQLDATPGYLAYITPSNTATCEAGDGATRFTATSSATFTDNLWHHIVCTSNGTGTLSQYVDGQITTIATGPTTTALTNTNDFRVGNGTAASTFFSGSIDEPFVTDNQISTSYVKHIYEVGYRALQGHTSGLGGGGADTNQQLGGTSSAIIDARPDINNQFLYAAHFSGGDPEPTDVTSKVDLNSDTLFKKYTDVSNTPSGGSTVLSGTSSIAVGYNLEVVGSSTSGVKSIGVDNNSTATAGNFVSKTVTLPEAVTSVYIWTNSYVDASDGGSSLTVSASNDGGSNYVTCSNTNNDTNQTPQENEYVCKFTTANTSLKVKFAFARTATKENNYIGQYGVGWTSSGADFAENYVTDEKDLDIANLVRIKNGGINTLVGKTISKYDESLMGVVSTRPGLTLGPDNGSTPGYSSQSEAGTHVIPIALSGRVPVKINAEGGAIHKGDYITASSVQGIGMRATKSGKVIGQALEDWDPTDPNASDRILVFINPGYTPGVLTADGSLNVDLPVSSGEALAQGNIIKMIFGIGAPDATGSADATGSGVIKSMNDFIAGLTQNANLDTVQAVIIKAQGIASNIIKGSEIITDKLTTKNTNVKLLSPVPGDTNIAVQIGSTATPSGQFVIQNASGSAVAAIDNLGNATFSGVVNSQELAVNSNASVAGTLYADNIKSKSLDDIKSLLTQVESDQNLMKQAANWNTLTATNSATFDKLAISDLYVTNQGAFNSLSVSSSITIGADLVISSQSNQVTNQLSNSLDTLSAPLKIQSLAMAPVEIMAGLVKIDTKGNVQIAGDLAVAGKINASGLTLAQNIASNQSATDSANLLTLKDQSGNQVGAINASGAAMLNNVITQGLTIAADKFATPSAQSGSVITTNASIGKAVIPGGTSEITIKNPKVTDYTLVYVTPTSTTDNYVLYVKSKENGQFVVGFTNPISVDVSFNWWIVQVSQ